eukprot:scaffold54454_cov45-Attheya_sp.AAC.1
MLIAVDSGDCNEAGMRLMAVRGPLLLQYVVVRIFRPISMDGAVIAREDIEAHSTNCYGIRRVLQSILSLIASLE